MMALQPLQRNVVTGQEILSLEFKFIGNFDNQTGFAAIKKI